VKPWRKGRLRPASRRSGQLCPGDARPWRIKAFLDYDGHAAINPTSLSAQRLEGPPIEILWAVLNSPIGNAMPIVTPCRSIYDGLIAKRPSAATMGRSCPGHVVEAVRAYLQVVSHPTLGASGGQRDKRHAEDIVEWNATVMRAYDLPGPAGTSRARSVSTAEVKKEERRQKESAASSATTTHPEIHLLLAALHDHLRKGSSAQRQMRTASLQAWRVGVCTRLLSAAGKRRGVGRGGLPPRYHIVGLLVRPIEA